VLVLAALGKFTLWAAVLMDAGTALLVIGNGMLVLRWRRTNAISHDNGKIASETQQAKGLGYWVHRMTHVGPWSGSHCQSHGKHSHHPHGTGACKSCPSPCCDLPSLSSPHVNGACQGATCSSSGQVHACVGAHAIPNANAHGHHHEPACCTGNDQKHASGHGPCKSSPRLCYNLPPLSPSHVNGADQGATDRACSSRSACTEPVFKGILHPKTSH
jgi:hypothetical protein